MVVDKRPGVSIHNEGGEGLIQQLRIDFATDQLFPVHRLDKATSGLLVCAKTRSACSVLSQLFQYHQVEKYYLAVTNKKPRKKQGAIIGDMERTRSGNWKLTKTRQNPAITHFFSYGLGEGRRLFLLKPSTGKTHQLRVVLKSLGSPIVGDQRYGVKNDQEPRMSLHAYSLRFNYFNHLYHFCCLPKGGSFTDSVNEYIVREFSEPWRLSWPDDKTQHV